MKMDIEIYKMRYKTEKNVNFLRILGEEFKNNNSNKGKIIINNKKFPLKDIISIQNVKQNKILLILNKNIYNKSCMFKNCELLLSVSKSVSESLIDYNDSEN